MLDKLDWLASVIKGSENIIIKVIMGIINNVVIIGVRDSENDSFDAKDVT